MNDYYDDVNREEQESAASQEDIPASDFIEPNAYDDPNEEKDDKKKLKIILASAGGALILVILLLIILKGPIHYGLALNYIGNNNYESAEKAISQSKGDKAVVLSEYIALRVDFNENYRSMLTDFDLEKINEWYEHMENVKNGYDALPDDLKIEIDDFYNRIAIIKDSLSVYSNIKYDVIDMMDVFAEINRLMATDESGKKTPFTVNEVLKKVERWKISCDNLKTFSANTPNGDTVYLLIYLINETYSECNEINNQMQDILVNYSGDKQITSAGEGREQFPTIKNSNGVTLSFDDPETYEEYMYADICTALMKYLADYYYGV